MKRRRRTQWVLAIGALALVAGTSAASNAIQNRDAPDVQLQRAIQRQMVDGDLQDAIGMYRQIAATPGVSARVAAEALFRMGTSYEYVDATEARRAYQHLVKEYPTQAAGFMAQRRLEALAQGGGSSNSMTVRLICRDCGHGFPIPTASLALIGANVSLSADGRLLAYPGVVGRDLAIGDLANGRETGMMLPWRSEAAGIARAPLLSPDLRSVAYSWASPSGSELRVARRQGRDKPTVLVADPAFESIEPSAWSPDAKSILVTILRRDGTWHLAWVSAADGKVTVFKSLDERRPFNRVSLSPDGRFLAYAASPSARTTGSPDRSDGVSTTRPDSEDHQVYVLPAKGGTETLVVRGPGRHHSPIWTPDNNHIVFVSNRYGSDSLWAVAVQNGRPVGAPTLVRPDVGEIGPVGITKSGGYYYAKSVSQFEEIFVTELPRAGAAATLVSGDNTLGGQQPSWSPDGRQIVFARRRPGPGQVYDVVVRNTETGEETRHDEERFRAGYGQRWIDNSSFLAWGVENTEGGPNVKRVLFQIDARSTEWRPLLALDVSGMPSAWGISPDMGTLYKASRGAESNLPVANYEPLDQILVLDVKTGEQKQVLRLPEPAYSFELSPDGRTFMLLSQTEFPRGNFHLSRMSLDGSGYRRLTEPLANVPYGKWTHDGRWFVFPVADSGVPGRSRLMRIPAEGGKTEPMGVEVMNLQGFELSPDNARIAFSVRNPTRTEIWAIENINALARTTR